MPIPSETVTQEQRANNAIRWKFGFLDKNRNSVSITVYKKQYAYHHCLQSLQIIKF